ncbi:signal recognition particle, alpha subunit, N-terminal-domain-containing protein [Rhizophagus diaphanus]|nr:signal recognition particle, alpha subunit, N-terminal-domain-containing protein [Rhizophagus diaphanus] [Rhizophagus sp. MUCL 43196]
MLDFFTILTKGGIVLWSKSFTRITSSPVNSLIGDVLIEERAGENSYTKDSYSLKWTFANELDLIFVAAYQKILQLAYIEELLATVKKFFCDKFANLIKDSGKLHKFDFDEDFDAILNKIEEKDSKSHEKLSKPRPFEKTKKFKETAEGSKKLSVSDISKPPTNPIISEDEIARNIEELHRHKGKRGRGGRKQSGTGRPNVSSDEKKQARKKTMRVWDDKVSKTEMESLDYSGDKGDSDKSSSVDPQNLVDQNQLGQFQDGYYEVQDIGQDDDEDEFEEDDYDETNDTSVENNSGSSILSFFKNITGQKEITEQDLVPVLAKMKEHLIKKNVAADIAAHLCDSVARNLVGQKTGSFKSIQSTVKQSMEMSLKRILTPKTSVDLLRDIAQAQSNSRPYSICFIGVNGVGKCFAKGTKILMYDGTQQNVEELNVGNQIMGDDDNPRTIQSTTKGEGIMYRIIPNDKGPAKFFECNDQHILVLKFAAEPYMRSEEIPIINRSPRIRLFWYEYDAQNNMIVKKNDSFYYGPGEDYPKKEVAKRAAIREMARRPNLVSSDFIWEIPIKDFLTASDEVQRSCLMFKPNQVIFKSVQGRFRVILSKILGVNPTNSQISAASWLVGAWIGGGIVKSPIIYVNENEKEILRAIEQYSEMLNWRYMKELHKAKLDDSEWKISFMSDYDIENGFYVLLQTLDILDTKKVPPVIMTDELDQVRLPLLAGILDINSHLLEENRIYRYVYRSLHERCEQICNLANLSGFYSTNIVANMKECSDNITTPSCTIISGNKLEKLPLVVSRKKVFRNRDHRKFNRDMVWGFKVEKVGLGSYYGFKVDKNERILLADLTVSHNSTNLSKTCFWLLQNGLKVLIAACDTFRSGAVEQLRVHVRNLNALGQNSNVELYERGYGKDAAGIAKDAINYAKINKFDVVLIDTAGRMQDNEPLMRALAKLVSVNNPDKIIFVGEALVGNEAVDQLTKFNQALKDFSGLQDPRHIDGMILTKFDTVDDKVGAALSMTYTTGQPILFVGTGQTYTDLKNMRVGHIIHSLLKE